MQRYESLVLSEKSKLAQLTSQKTFYQFVRRMTNIIIYKINAPVKNGSVNTAFKIYRKYKTAMLVLSLCVEAKKETTHPVVFICPAFCNCPEGRFCEEQ